MVVEIHIDINSIPYIQLLLFHLLHNRVLWQLYFLFVNRFNHYKAYINSVYLLAFKILKFLQLYLYKTKILMKCKTCLHSILIILAVRYSWLYLSNFLEMTLHNVIAHFKIFHLTHSLLILQHSAMMNLFHTN